MGPTTPPYISYLSEKSKLRKSVVSKLTQPYIDRLESGRISLKRYNSEVGKALGIRPDEVRWFEVFKRIFKVNEEMLDLAAILHNEYVTAYLSNVDRSRHSYTSKIIDKGPFDYRFVSYAIGFRKPDPRIFKYALKRMKLRPEETVFIDNLYPNVLGARRVGMNGILFEGRRKLDLSLAKLGL